MQADHLPFQERTSVEPSLRPDRGDEPSFVKVSIFSRDHACGNSANLLRVPLLYHPKTAEFTLFTIKVAVVIRIARHKAVAADTVIGFNSINNMHRER